MLCPISGGNWNNSTNAGVWALNLNNTRANSNNNVGGRSDLVSRLAKILMAIHGAVEQRETFSCLGRNRYAAPFLVAAGERQGVFQ